MAKFDESDPRWIVQAREDGTNVNQWHWSEKDCSEWSKQRLEQLLGDLTLLNGPATAKTTGLKSVEGDSILNIRKAKLIASYELAIKVRWQGTTAGGQHGSGLIELPYVADENHDEDPEVKVLLPTEDAASQQLKAEILAKGKEPIYAAIRTYVQELRSGVPGKPGNSSSSAAAAAAGSGSGAAAAAANGSAAAAAVPRPGSSGSGSAAAKKSSKRSVSMTEKFYARSQDIFECFTVQGRIQAFTQSAALVQPQPGGTFSWFNGNITGTFQELVPGQRLVMSWRFNSWEEGCLSKVEVELSEPEPGNTVLQLKHTGLPEADKFGHGDVQEQVEQGWRGQIFNRIRAVFGYGV
uniref:Activator of Hsp90 ATPase AHSA1-like N-terminal domain-containing protein n=1 Tax=Tetradesmus obliquus TaxID=3088 RepID=A0A383VZK0_TETOB|eukprot:jgi/Sobl393_1/4731/SZX70303.1